MPVEEHAKHPHSPYLFVSPKTGTMFDPDSFRHTHEKILKAIGAEHIRFHDLRHPYVKHTTKIFSLRSMAFQAQAYPFIYHVHQIIRRIQLPFLVPDEALALA